MLDIIVPHYKEPWEIGGKLFAMLDLQRGISFSDFHVLIVNDGAEWHLPDELFANRPYQVRQIDIEHGGVSKARNAGIDAATEDWLMFCDFDDTFAHVYALRDILGVLPAENIDMLHSEMLVEDMTNGNNRLFFSPESQRFVFTHGKVYRRQFLLDECIRFDETLNFQEDSLFNATIIARVPYQRIGEIKTRTPPYVWIRRDSSVTNSGREDEAMFSQFLRNLTVTEENRQHRSHECYCGMVTRTAWDAYYMMRNTNASNRVKRTILDMFVPWMKERMDEYGQVDDETMLKIREVSRNELCDHPAPDSPEDVKRWLDAIAERR